MKIHQENQTEIVEKIMDSKNCNLEWCDQAERLISGKTNMPLALLPSPLLCPHHTFLASLILASKSNWDRCYSNKAWTNLSDLPPRRIGRCEWALIDAPEWRLLVGKLVFVYNSTKSLAEMQYQQWTLQHLLDLWLSTSLLLVNMLFSVSIVYCHFTHVHHYSLYK